MADQRRQKRLESMYFKEAMRLFRFDIHDPRLSAVVPTRASLTGDLRQAKLFVKGPLEGTARRTVERGLQSVTPMVQRVVGELLNLRFVPLLEILIDEHAAAREHMDALFHQIERERRENGSSAEES